MSDYYDPVYKGCTSPGTVFGIPMLPFILGTLCFAQLGIAGFMLLKLAGLAPVVVVYATVFRWAQRVSRHDDQRLLQMILRLRARRGQRRLRPYWGAVSFSPFSPFGRSGD